MTILSRADRRHDAQRVKANRLKHHLTGVQTAETPALCSCPMCGNPRKWFKQQTIQERRMFQGKS